MKRFHKEIIVDQGELYLLLPTGREANPSSLPLWQRLELQPLLDSARLCSTLLDSARSHSFYVRLTPLVAADLERAVEVVVELARCDCTASLVSPRPVCFYPAPSKIS